MTYLDCKEGSFEARLDGIDYEAGSVLLLVHQYGIPADPVEARNIAQRFGLILVEDVASSLGAKWNMQPTGSFGDAAIISFEYSKTISACKGGAVVYANKVLADQVTNYMEEENATTHTNTESIWRQDALNGLLNELSLIPLIYGTFTLPLFRSRYPSGFIDRSQTVKSNDVYRADFGVRRAWLAAHMLERLPAIAVSRRRVADIYREILIDDKKVMLPPIPSEAEPVYTHFPLLLPPAQRESVVLGLWAAGIDPGFNFSYLCGGAAAAAAAPVAHYYTERVLTLPVSSRINDRLARYIAKKLRSLVQKA